jgi:hypothetical protein
VTLRCTSINATAVVPLRDADVGPGIALSGHWFMIHWDTGNATPGCSVIDDGAIPDPTNLVGSSVTLESQFRNNSSFPTEDPDFQELLYIYFDAGFIDHVTIALHSLSVSGGTNVGQIFIGAKEGPPTLSEVLADPCGVLTTLTGLSSLGTIGDGVSSPALSPPLYVIPVGLAAPFILRVDAAIAGTGISLDVLYQTDAVIGISANS